jgi:hypothetical protein
MRLFIVEKREYGGKRLQNIKDDDTTSFLTLYTCRCIEIKVSFMFPPGKAP